MTQTANLFLCVASDKNQVFLSARDNVDHTVTTSQTLEKVKLSLQEIFFPSGLPRSSF